MAELAGILLRRSGFKGVCTVDFKRDQRDGVLKLMEVNVRMPRMNWLASYCGVNFPWIVYRDLIDGVRDYATAYRQDVYWTEVFADVKNSLLHYDRERYSLGEYLRPYVAPDRTFALLSSHDPLPFLTQAAVAPLRVLTRLLRG